MDPFTIIMGVFAAVMGIASAVSTARANKENIRLAEETREDQQEFARESAATANSNTLNMFNTVDSPKAKVAQLKEAGLSPALIYGQGGTGGSAHVSAQAPQASQGAPLINPIFGQNFMSDILAAMKTPSEIENTKSGTKVNEATVGEITKSIEKMDADIEKIWSDISVNSSVEELNKAKKITEEYTQKLTEVNTNIAKIELEIKDRSKEDLLATIHAQREAAEQAVEKLKKEIEGLEIDNANKQKIYNATIAKMQAEAAKAWAETGKAEAETVVAQNQQKLQGWQLKELQKKIEDIDEDIKLKKWEKQNYWNIKAGAGDGGIIGGTIGKLWSWSKAVIEVFGGRGGSYVEPSN